MMRLALPDGHQQKHVIELLKKTKIEVSGYDLGRPQRRPGINIEGVTVNVIRPQDMPAQTSLGNFDLAVSGADWLFDHKAQFPRSPVEGLLDLGVGRVRVVAVVSDDLQADDISGIKELSAKGYFPTPKFRIASEYVNIADHFGMKNHIKNYRVIPTYGATEALLPEDADMIIENTETGTTLKKNRLKIISELFVSTGCLIGRAGILSEGDTSVIRIFDEFSQISGVERHKGIRL
jgi:ATP phosphoribosyltransferase